ncbi:EamA family transporter [Sporolactobacillus pectinivorans]|uniref:EamA family transporter n=1 Tax=Sporolactobacillus pectinivorans TaxID=1591408 RepID=UPI000C264C6F|nr:EamA family transporter [Sporolactobacillus pectinivorans]
MIEAALLIIMTMFGSLGGYFFKRCTMKGIGLSMYFLVNLGIGGIFYVSGALLNIWLLKMLPYTIVYPLTAITYIWTLVFSYFFLREKINRRKISGVLLILLGACLLVIKLN